MKLFGYKVFGYWLPYIGFTHMPFDVDGELLVDENNTIIRDNPDAIWSSVLVLEWFYEGVILRVRHV